MEMCLKVSTLVLLTAVNMAISASRLVMVDEPPSSVQVPLGSSTTLTCSFKLEPHIQAEKIRVDWYLNPSGPSNKISLFTEVFNLSAKQDLEDPDAEKTQSSFTLSNAAFNDSGLYFCEVRLEIPCYGFTNSCGTHVDVTESKTERTTFPSLSVMTEKQVTMSPTVGVLPLDWWMWAVLGGSTLLLIVLVLVCVLMKTRACRRRVTECPVYANTHTVGSANRQPSPCPGVHLGNLKIVQPSHRLWTP